MNRCPLCQASFTCGVADNSDAGPAITCWCMTLPRLPATTSLRDENGKATSCLCPGCLRARQQGLMTSHSGGALK